MRPAVRARLLVADRAAAGRVTAELARNQLLAHPAGSARAAGQPAAGQAAAAALGRRTRLAIGRPSGAVLVVPGTGAERGGVHTLTAETYGRVRRAEQITARAEIRAVILSGWNGTAGRGLSEAKQMMAAWAGPDVPVILDEAARTTAENALCAAAITAALGDVRKVIVVASWGNALRLRFAFRAALREQGLRPALVTLWGLRHGASWRPGLAGLFRLRQHLLAGRIRLGAGRPASPADLAGPEFSGSARDASSVRR